jgi:hypothetical protein
MERFAGRFAAIDIASVSWLILGTPKNQDRALELRVESGCW